MTDGMLGGRYHTLMALRPLNSFFPDTDELLAADMERLGEVLLVHLTSYEGQVKQNGGFYRDYLLGMLEKRSASMGLGQQPPGYDYGPKQVEVTRRVMEGWYWLERQGFLIPDPSRRGWHVLSTEGDRLLSKLNRHERWEKLGVDLVKQDLANGGLRYVGGPPEVREQAIEWIRRKEGHAMLPARKRSGTGGASSFIAESRIDELRTLSSPDFDFQKLIRLCEELNSSYDIGNLYATAMLTRGVLDHVPPVFGHMTFAQVANNYGAGGRSFKETMQHLDGAARKISDGHLHMPIRNSESIPTPQQVYCGPQLDVLLSEIVRIIRRARPCSPSAVST